MEHHIRVQKTARYHRLGPPQGGVVQTWFVLHGYQQLGGRFIHRFRPLDDGSRRIIAPEALSRFYVSPQLGRHGPESRVGATWMTREDRLNEIRDYVEYLDALAAEVAEDGGGGHTTVLGFSQGVATAVRWVVLGSVRPDRLVLWGDLVPPDLDLGLAATALAGVDVVLARGHRDAIFGGAGISENLSALADAGISARLLEYDGGHEIDPPLLRRLAEE